MVQHSEPYTWLAIDRLSSDVDLAALDRALDLAQNSEGLVLDLRRNLGGLFVVAKHIVERFLPNTVETVLAPPHPTSTWFGLFEVEVFLRNVWEPRAPRFTKPVVVLTSALTGSSAEHTARMLQQHCGATVIGERTVGAEAVVQIAKGPDGGELRFGSTRVLDRTGVGLQQDGVAPDVSVRLTLQDVQRLGPRAAIADWEARLQAAARAAIRHR
jgi:carboxyl-terminal processing protease